MVIPTHNRAAMLKEALDSVLAQEGAGAEFPIEIVVVDDASSDDTPTVVQAYPHVRYIRLPTNRGHSAARNAGITASTGRYLAFLDDDDVWLPYWLRVMVPALESHPGGALAYGQVIMRTPESEHVLPHPESAPSGSVLGPLLMGNFVPTMAVLVRREAIERIGGFDEEIPGVEDYDLWIRLARDVHFLFVATPVAVYRHGFQSKHLAEVTDGRFADLLLRVLRKAVATLPDADPFVALKQDAQAGIDFRTAGIFVFGGQCEAARPLLRTALSRLPMMTHGVYARQALSGFIGQLAVASPSPIATTEAFCQEIARAAGSLRPGGERGLRQLTGEIWGGVAIQLGFGVRPRDREAASAALRAAYHYPGILGHRKRLLWLLARGLVGRRCDAIFTAIGLWTQRRTLIRG